MDKQYTETRDGSYSIAETRVSLDSIVYAFLDGFSPEAIATECFPTLTLEQVYGAITYYLAHRTEIDAYLEREEAELTTLRQELQANDPQFYQKLARSRFARSATMLDR